jgi:hypothetical protein
MNLSINHQLGILLNPEKIQFHKKKLKGMVYDIPFATLLCFLRPKIAGVCCSFGGSMPSCAWVSDVVHIEGTKVLLYQKSNKHATRIS